MAVQAVPRCGRQDWFRTGATLPGDERGCGIAWEQALEVCPSFRRAGATWYYDWYSGTSMSMGVRLSSGLGAGWATARLSSLLQQPNVHFHLVGLASPPASSASSSSASLSSPRTYQKDSPPSTLQRCCCSPLSSPVPSEQPLLAALVAVPIRSTI